MASTNVVAEILSVPQLPANRPYDHVQRIFTGLFLGSFVGSLVALVFFGTQLTMIGYAIPFIAAITILVVGFVAFKVAARGEKDESIPVVAKVLGTDEPVVSRRLKSGALAVPVAVRPLSGEDFRTIVALNPKGKSEAEDLAVGTIIALRQIEPEAGDLVAAPANDAQRQLMDRWASSVKMVSNKAPIKPLRRGALERKGLAASLEFYGGMGLGICGLLLLILGFGG